MTHNNGRSIQIIVVFLCTLFVSGVNAQIDTSYAFIVAGHAYGAHDGVNIGLHPPLLNSLDSGYDPNAAFIVLTGDIVNKSTSESWQQVENELNHYALPTYYVMGNHDDNAIGYQVFSDKFGGAYYSFYVQSELYVVLNSTEKQRSISANQLEFLQEQLDLAGESVRNVFIFFHEILWNSHEKYVGVKSNSRSRYHKIVNYSNYWEGVHPILLEQPDRNFFVIAGDVAGNADAIAAFYDTWDHITFVASGMGEVEDENYLLVQVHDVNDIEFGLVPLDLNTELPGLEYYSVPPAPETIVGPNDVLPGSRAIKYFVPEVFNASTYTWELPGGVSGISDSNQIECDFAAEFREGTISVRAYREGFGSGPASSLLLKSR
ncbi:metallophosphoesterase [Planctomycetota bacterium]